ncbi:MAG: ATP-binding protein [Candidatus Kryptoniota bacterium]
MRLQNEITIAIDALHEKSGEIVSLQERLRTFESQAALGKIAAKLAHEIGSPLNAIYTSVQLMLEKDIQDEERVKLQVIERQVETMITIINQLLQTRRIAVPSKKNVVLKDLIEETRLVTEPRLEGKPIDLNIQLENPSAIICADPVQIQQVLINLFNNSIEAIESRKKIPSGHHTDGRGKIEVKVYEDYELRISDFGFPNIRFDVSDNGTGVPGEIVSQLFNDYISSKKPNGNGIGLVICKEIIDRHGGKIFLSRNSEKGSTFSIILPIADSGRDI